MPKTVMFFCLSVLALQAYGASKSQDIEIPRSAYKDVYKYYVLEEGKQATLNYIIFKRQSFDTIVYFKAEINCPSRYIRLIGSSTQSARSIGLNPTQWVQPTIGTAEWDIVNFSCR